MRWAEFWAILSQTHRVTLAAMPTCLNMDPGPMERFGSAISASFMLYVELLMSTPRPERLPSKSAARFSSMSPMMGAWSRFYESVSAVIYEQT
jgi:hypothetical protein